MTDTISSTKAKLGVLYTIITLCIVFSTELPIQSLHSISSYASINSEDIAVLLVTVVLLWSYFRSDDWEITIEYPVATISFIAVTTWIFITVVAAIVRADSSVLSSFLWSFKMVEILIFFIVIQQQVDRDVGATILHTLNISGVLLALASVGVKLIGVDRVRIFWGNPNILASFFILIVLLNLSQVIVNDRPIRKFIHYVATLITLLAILTTVSRSGVLGLLFGGAVLVILLRDRISATQIAGGIGLGVTGLMAAPLLIDVNNAKRFVNWIKFENGQLVLADTAAAGSFEIRLQLIQYALDLFIEQPFFGYGWFAAPSRVGWLDVYYTVLIVEIGIIGFFLFFWFHASLLSIWFRARSQGAFVYGSAAIGWYIGLLVQSIAGPFPRVPLMLFLTVLVVVAVSAVSEVPIHLTTDS